MRRLLLALLYPMRKWAEHTEPGAAVGERAAALTLYPSEGRRVRAVPKGKAA